MSLKGMDWLKEQIKKLEITNSKFDEEIKKIVKIDPNTYNEFQEWTPLKLILLNYVLDVCTTIVNKMPFFENKYYVDLFAGSGLNKIKNKEDFLIGSPFIASLNHRDKYTKMFFCELNSSFNNALTSRLNFLKNDKLVVFKDYKSNLGSILNEVKNGKTYSFFFIDPYCTGFDWDSMKRILQVRSDIIFTFMSSQIFRTVGLANVGLSQGGELISFFGNQSWRNARSHEELVEIYRKNILKERTDAPIRTIRIKSKQFNFCYHMFFITNKTKQDCPWLRAVDIAKKEIESQSDLAVKTALDIIKKRQTDLSQF